MTDELLGLVLFHDSLYWSVANRFYGTGVGGTGVSPVLYILVENW